MTNDAFLWYNVPPWENYGLAVPCAGNDCCSQNGTIRDLVSSVGRNLQGIMRHVDASLRTPPSINTLRRTHKLCTRIRQILAARAVTPSTNLMESTHANPAPEQFLLFPTPYFNVRNPWMKSWSQLILQMLTEMMQHTENARPLEITTDFAGLVSQYPQRVYKMMAVELLQVSRETAEQPDFTITDEIFGTYNPSAWFTQTELMDTVPDLCTLATEDDFMPLSDGIFCNAMPNLGRWKGGCCGDGTTASRLPTMSGVTGEAPTPTSATWFASPTV